LTPLSEGVQKSFAVPRMSGSIFIGTLACTPPRPSNATVAPQSNDVVLASNDGTAGAGADTVTNTVCTAGGGVGEGGSVEEGPCEEETFLDFAYVLARLPVHKGPSSVEESSGIVNSGGCEQACNGNDVLEKFVTKSENERSEMLKLVDNATERVVIEIESNDVELAFQVGPSSVNESSGMENLGARVQCPVENEVLLSMNDGGVAGKLMFAVVILAVILLEEEKIVEDTFHRGPSSVSESSGMVKLGGFEHASVENEVLLNVDESGVAGRFINDIVVLARLEDRGETVDVDEKVGAREDDVRIEKGIELDEDGRENAELL